MDEKNNSQGFYRGILRYSFLKNHNKLHIKIKFSLGFEHFITILYYSVPKILLFNKHNY